MTQKDIIDAYVFLRKNNQSIPDDVLDFIKDAAIGKLKGETLLSEKIHRRIEQLNKEAEEMQEEFRKEKNLTIKRMIRRGIENHTIRLDELDILTEQSLNIPH